MLAATAELARTSEDDAEVDKAILEENAKVEVAAAKSSESDETAVLDTTALESAVSEETIVLDAACEDEIRSVELIKIDVGAELEVMISAAEDVVVVLSEAADTAWIAEDGREEVSAMSSAAELVRIAELSITVDDYMCQ